MPIRNATLLQAGCQRRRLGPSNRIWEVFNIIETRQPECGAKLPVVSMNAGYFIIEPVSGMNTQLSFKGSSIFLAVPYPHQHSRSAQLFSRVLIPCLVLVTGFRVERSASATILTLVALGPTLPNWRCLHTSTTGKN